MHMATQAIKGTVLHYEDARRGAIMSGNGDRYLFRLKEWRGKEPSVAAAISSPRFAT